MIFKPGFASAIAAFSAAVLAVLLGHDYLRPEVQGFIVLAASIVMHAHVSAKRPAGPQGAPGAGMRQMLEDVARAAEKGPTPGAQ